MLRPRGGARRYKRTTVFARGAVEFLVAESDPVRFPVEREDVPILLFGKGCAVPARTGRFANRR
jgi:hypothetical protein